LSDRLELFYCIENSLSSTPSVSHNLLSKVDLSVMESLKPLPNKSIVVINDNTNTKTYPIYYSIKSVGGLSTVLSSTVSANGLVSVSDPQRNLLPLPDDSLLRAINNWNDNSIDQYLKENQSNERENKEDYYQLVAPDIPRSSSLIKNENTMDYLMNSNTMHGLLNDLVQENTNTVRPNVPLFQDKASNIQKPAVVKENSSRAKNDRLLDDSVSTMMRELPLLLEPSLAVPPVVSSSTGKAPQVQTQKLQQPPPVFQQFNNYENSLYVKDLYHSDDHIDYGSLSNNGDLSKSSASLSNRPFAHIFDSHSKEGNSILKGANVLSLCQSATSSSSLFQNVLSNSAVPSSSTVEKHPVPLVRSPPASSSCSTTSQRSSKASSPNSAKATVFAGASPATVVTPISDTEHESNHSKASVPPLPPTVLSFLNNNNSRSNGHLSLKINQSKDNVPSTPVSSSKHALLSQSSPAEECSGSKSKKRKFNGLQQKREELLSDNSQDSQTPVKKSRSTSSSGSKALPVPLTPIEKHVLAANIISGICTTSITVVNKIPSFVEKLSRKGRSRPDLPRITPTLIGHLTSSTVASAKPFL
jgi:hypothetical protein